MPLAPSTSIGERYRRVWTLRRRLDSRGKAVILGLIVLSVLTWGWWTAYVDLWGRSIERPDRPALAVVAFAMFACSWVVSGFTRSWFLLAAFQTQRDLLEGKPLVFRHWLRIRGLFSLVLWRTTLEAGAIAAAILVALPLFFVEMSLPEGTARRLLNSLVTVLSLVAYVLVWVRFWFGGRLLVLERVSVLRAPREAWRLTKGRGTELLIFLLATRFVELLVGAACFAPFAGLFALLPGERSWLLGAPFGAMGFMIANFWNELAFTELFLELRQESEEPESPEPQEAQE